MKVNSDFTHNFSYLGHSSLRLPPVQHLVDLPSHQPEGALLKLYRLAEIDWKMGRRAQLDLFATKHCLDCLEVYPVSEEAVAAELEFELEY